MKKNILIVLFLIIVIAIGFYFYKKGYFGTRKPVLKTEDLLALNIKDKSLDQEFLDTYKSSFEKLKAKLETDSKSPASAESWTALGIIKKSVGDYEGARDIWIKAATLNPRYSVPFYNLGDLYANFLNEPQKAEEAYKKAMANDPQDVNIYLNLADVYRYKIPGKENLYDQTLLAGLTQIPNDPTLTGFLASYYRQTNQKEKAIEWYEKLLALNPNNQMAKEDLKELKAGN